jgi:small-conductance mechanosensitive channel
VPRCRPAYGVARARGRGRGCLGAALILLALLGQAIASAAAQVLPGLPAGEASSPAVETDSARDELRAELEALLRRLEDPEQAKELASTVRSLLDAMDRGAGDTAATADEETAAAQPEQNRVSEALRQARPAAAELLGRIEEDVRERIDTVREAAEQVYDTTMEVPDLLAWAGTLVDEPAEQQAFVRVAVAIVVILGAGLVAMWLAARGLAPARRALVFRDRDHLLSRGIMAVLLILLRAIPVLVFAVVANALIIILQPDQTTEIWLSAGISAIVLVRLGLVLTQAVLSPAAAEARLVPLSDATARLLTRYIHGLLALGIYGFTLLSVLRWQGMPRLMYGTLDRLIALALLITAVTIIIRRRRDVARWIGRLAGPDPKRSTSSIPWRRLGAIWHIFAIIYLGALFVLYIIEDFGLFLDVLITSGLSLSLLIGLLVALRYVETQAEAIDSSLASDEEFEDEDEDQAAEAATSPARRRSGPLLMVLRLAIVLVAALTFLQVWGIDTWLLVTGDGPAGRLLLIGVIVVAIYLLWFVINRFIANYLRELDARAGAARSSTRTRTILVLARNAVFVTLTVIGGMVVLSELGLNIGPLLAGAGVIGIAIGFGAQHLVQDVITGLFNLVEDTFAVGDVVDLGGKAGVVEAVTIRTVRLRDLGGNVHTIPFSAIAVVTNMTKDFSYAALDMGVAYRENVDQVMQVMREVAEGLRRDRAYRRIILEPLEVLGLDAFADSAVIIKARLKVRPGSQWLIGREYKRRLKNRFDELGIEIPFPHQTIYFGQDREGAAPPARVLMTTAEDLDKGSTSEPPSPRPVPRLAD